jgi:hypothetical protein
VVVVTSARAPERYVLIDGYMRVADAICDRTIHNAHVTP